MSKQRLQVTAPALIGLPKHNTALVADLAKLATQFRGHLDLSYHSATTSFTWRIDDLIDIHNLLRDKVEQLKEKYHDTVFDLFTESLSHSAETWSETFPWSETFH
jgi:hypothetical protein